MIKRFGILFFAFVFLVSFVSAQSPDTLVYAEGKIVNAATKEPVSAKITYQSLPYGNRIGVLHDNTTYSFPMFDNERYSISIEAPGYSTVKYMLDPAEANVDMRLVKNIELVQGTPHIGSHPVGQLMRLENLIFEVSKSKISPDSYDELDLIVNMMNENKTMVIQLEGHTDYQGDSEDNMKLSQQRVDAVKSYIVSKKIHKTRVKTKAFGGTMPLSRDNTPEAHRLNRRVELRVLEN